VNFLDPKFLPLTILDKSYNPYLVALSIIIAIISSFTAFGFLERINASTDRLHKTLWVMFGAVSMGIGIWAMHFIGSLALILPTPVSYNLNITLLSVIPAIMASTVVFWLMNQTSFNLRCLFFSGALLGAGISIVHYIGMAAMELNASMVYLKSIFILSVVVAIILATIALKIKCAATRHDKYQFIIKQQCQGAVVMGVAVSGMHYIAMQSVIFMPVENINSFSKAIDASVLSGIIALVVLLLLIVALIVPHMLRFKQMVNTLQKNEEDLKIAAMAFQTHEAILVTDADKKIIRINKAFTRILGYSETEILGKTPDVLSSGKESAFFYKNLWNTIINKGKWSGEIWNRRKNGEIFPEWQTVSAVKDDHDKITHFISFFSDITEFKLAEKEIEKLAYYDPLTELPNRRLLHERLEHELNIAKRYQRAGILFFLDLDHFKRINDSLGHTVGDQLLIKTAKRLQSLLRETDTAVRIGGDEFVIMASAQDGIHADLLEQSSIIAEKILNAINSPYFIGEHELFISTSIGITMYTGVDETVEILLKRADTAMYQAKDAGRNTFRFYQQSMQDVVDAKLTIEKNLRVAISKNEISLYYQPQLSDNNKLIGAEALIRWQHPELGIIAPVEFIPIAEETGLIIPVGYWVIETVCRQINSWDNQEVYIPLITINISAKQFYQADFVSVLVHTVFEYHIQPRRVMLEITEGVFLGNLDEAIDKMNVLKQNGFTFSIDDFGTGYSSLTYLKKLPFDQLKIDQSFIRGLINNTTDAAIVKAIIVMAKSMNLDLIAEGVETAQHLRYLSDFGCHNYQGNYFSKPLSGEQLAEYIKERIWKNLNL
jgi:diguanylate cyclase (GGDEF)-like protein/PAS domain S-box-containing protein